MAAIAGRRYPPSVSPVGNLCHFVLLDKDESCPTADLSNIGHTNGPAYSTGRLLNVPRDGHRTTGHSRNIMPPLHAMLQTAYGGIKINKNNCKTNCVNLANYRTETSLEWSLQLLHQQVQWRADSHDQPTVHHSTDRDSVHHNTHTSHQCLPYVSVQQVTKLNSTLSRFYRMMRMHSADCAVARCLSICQTPLSCWNG